MFQIKQNQEEITQELISPFWRKPLKVSTRNKEQVEKADWINQCAKLTGKKYVQMASLFQGYSLDFIRDLYLKSQETTGNKSAYFWVIWKSYK